MKVIFQVCTGTACTKEEEIQYTNHNRMVTKYRLNSNNSHKLFFGCLTVRLGDINRHVFGYLCSKHTLNTKLLYW